MANEKRSSTTSYFPSGASDRWQPIPSKLDWSSTTPAKWIGSVGGHTSASGPGAPCAKTTAPMATRGIIFPHDHARSRAYRWNEDGIGGFCDDKQHICLAVALWNEKDPILKERMFGLSNPAGQPRRGRQGVLLLPRRHADPLLHEDALQVSASGVSLRRPAESQWPPQSVGARI